MLLAKTSDTLADKYLVRLVARDAPSARQFLETGRAVFLGLRELRQEERAVLKAAGCCA